MGKGGGGSIPGPTPQELEQQSLQNQLLNMQITEANDRKNAEAAKNSPQAINERNAATRTTQQTTFQKTRSTEEQAAIDRVTGQLKDAGLENLIPQYVAQINADYGALQYRPGQDASSSQRLVSEAVDGTIDPNNFDEARYLAANPDVARSVAEGGWNGSAFNHYQATGRNEGRTYGTKAAQYATDVNAGTADTWDDISSLNGKDYLGSIINDTRSGRKNTAFTGADTALQTRLNALGLDQGTRDQLYTTAKGQLQNTYDTSGLSANDYSKVFDANSVLDSVMNNELSNRRAGYTTATRSAFGTYDPNKDFSDTADDSYINDIVGTQYGDAKSALDRAKARGALTDAGYTAGLSQLGTSKLAADSTAQTLGGAVLDRYRTGLTGIKDTALTKAGGYNFGDTFDPNTFLNDYTTKKTGFEGSLGGDISSALAGQNFFDVGSVLTKAGYAQGAQNTASLQDGFGTPALAGIAAQRDKTKDAGRGLTGTGTF